jgi:exodeoxyribonuclease-3
MARFRLATFNVNSVRARLGIVLDWLERREPDVLCLQETKVTDADFPAAAFEQLGYNVARVGEKSYNGVAIVSRRPLREVSCGFEDGEPDDQARFIAARTPPIRVLNTYVPQGRDVQSPHYAYKLEWLERLRRWLARHARPQAKLAWVGDINVAPEPIDVHDPRRLEGHVCFNPDVRAIVGRIRDGGMVDVFRKHQGAGGHFTFFDYRVRNAVKRGLGWRVDHIHATAALANRSTGAFIDLDVRTLERPSDHAPLVADFDL